MARQSVLKFPKEFDKQVREACKHYDKPKRIGKLSIASMALQAVLLEDPAHPIDEVGRGHALQEVIGACLDELRPKEMPLEPPQEPSLEFEVYITLYLYLHKRDPFRGAEIAKLGENQSAIKHLAQALPIFTELGDAKGQLLAHLNLAQAHMQPDHLDMAQQHAQAATKADYQNVSKTDYAEALRVYAEVLFAQGDLATALTTAQQALHARRLPNAPDSYYDPFYAKQTCQTLARIYSALGNTKDAEQYSLLAEELQEKIND